MKKSRSNPGTKVNLLPLSAICLRGAIKKSTEDGAQCQGRDREARLLFHECNNPTFADFDGSPASRQPYISKKSVDGLLKTRYTIVKPVRRNATRALTATIL